MKTFLPHRELDSSAPHKPASAGSNPAGATNFGKAEGNPKGQHILVDQLGGVAFRPKICVRAAIRNGPPIPLLARGKSNAPRQWFEVKNDANADSAEIRLYDEIGEDWFGEGDSAKSFADALDKIPKGRKILVRINSPGGNVYDGIAMYKRLRERKDDVTTQIDGVALSIASVIALGGGKVIIAKSGQFMVHDPWTAMYVEGTADDIEEQARLVKDALIAAKKSIVSAYVDRTGKSPEDISALMSKTSWYVGDEAKSAAFVDEVSDEEAISNNFDISNFRRVPEAFRKLQNSAAQGGGQSQHTQLMNKEAIIALLKEHGIEVEANSTIEQLQAKLKEVLAKAKEKPADKPAAEGADIKAMSDLLKQITNERDAERKKNIETRIDAAIDACKLEAAQRDRMVARCLTDISLLADIEARTPAMPPEGVSIAIETNASIHDIGKHVSRVSNEIVKDLERGDGEKASKKAMARATLIRKNEKRIGELWNEGTNTVDAQLQQDVIMDTILRAFKRVLFPVSNFATIFSNVPLKGTDKVQVPFLALDASSVTDWVDATGYVAADTTTDNREITIDKRKYVGISYTSSELSRQPFLLVQQQMELKGETLAFEVWKDIWSIVKAASFDVADGSASGFTAWPQAAAAMDSNKIIDLQSIADTLNWPTAGRLLFVNTAYDNFLKKDNAFKNAMAFGGSEILRTGMIPNILGFNYATNVNIQGNSENLAGVIAQRDAILVATAPITPTEDVIRSGTQYSMAVDPDTGIAVEYRSFGNSQLDKSLKFIESNYGYAKGNAANLKRLTTAA